MREKRNGRCVLALAAAITAGLFLFSAAYGETVSLKQAVAAGINQDGVYKNLQLDVLGADVRIAEAGKKKWFTLDVSGSYVFRSQQLEIQLPLPMAGDGIKAGSKHNYDLKLALTQPIYTGNLISNALRLEQLRAAAELLDIDLRKLETAGRIKASYFAYRLLETKKQSLALLIKSLQLHRDRLQELHEEDLVRKTDLLETDLKINESRLNVTEIQQQMEVEGLNFARLSTFKIQAVEADYQEPTVTQEDVFQRFLTAHPSLKVIAQNVRMLELRKKLVSGSYLPQVGAFAEMHYGRPGIDFFKNEWSVYFQGGISLAWKVFDWNRSKGERKLLDFSIEKLDNRKKDLLADVQTGLSQLYARRRSLVLQQETVRKLAETAQEDARLKEDLYKESQAANVDYLTALLNSERYLAMLQELTYRVRLLDVNINLFAGLEEK